LAARYVIHTVGPIFGRNHGRDAELLANSYLNSLKLARDNGVSTIAFPAISTGVYDYPKDEAAKVASNAIKKFLDADRSVQGVRLVFFKELDTEIFLENHNF
jgi:O-acetyl-ADP-ribose deacetylase (regulator of RNase III)